MARSYERRVYLTLPKLRLSSNLCEMSGSQGKRVRGATGAAGCRGGVLWNSRRKESFTPVGLWFQARRPCLLLPLLILALTSEMRERG